MASRIDGRADSGSRNRARTRILTDEEADAELNRLRTITTAYLSHDNRLLLMQRSPQRDFLPGVWSGIGGHVECHEVGDVQAACLREIDEETGLGEADIEGLTLRYLLLRQRKDELRQQFIYFGTAKTPETRPTMEGQLHWVPFRDVLMQPMTDSNRMMLEHYFTEGPQDLVMVGVLSGRLLCPEIRWSPISDWDV